MKRTIKLTEADLHRIVKGALNEIGDTPRGRKYLGKLAGKQYKLARANYDSAASAREKMTNDNGSSWMNQHWDSIDNFGREAGNKHMGHVEKLNKYADNNGFGKPWEDGYEDYAEGFNESRQRRLVSQITESVLRRLKH